MEIRADEISRIIRDQIRDYGKKVDVAETGTVLSQGDGIARIYGLSGAAAGELLEFPHGVRGMVLNLAGDHIARNGDAVDLHALAPGHNLGSNRLMHRARHWRHSAGTALGRRTPGLPFCLARTT